MILPYRVISKEDLPRLIHTDLIIYSDVNDKEYPSFYNELCEFYVYGKGSRRYICFQVPSKAEFATDALKVITFDEDFRLRLALFESEILEPQQFYD